MTIFDTPKVFNLQGAEVYFHGGRKPFPDKNVKRWIAYAQNYADSFAVLYLLSTKASCCLCDHVT